MLSVNTNISAREQLLDSLSIDSLYLDNDTIYHQSDPITLHGCTPYKPPIIDLLKHNGWNIWERNTDSDATSIRLVKEDKHIEIIEAPIWLGDHVVVNRGIMFVFKCYDYCTFMKKTNNITIATDIAKMKSLVYEVDIRPIIVLDSVNKSDGSQFDVNLFSAIKANIIKSGISLIESRSPYETASLVCTFSDSVDFMSN
jgi:hypothetical protein